MTLVPEHLLWIAISPVDQSFQLKNTDHAILMLSWRYRSYLVGGGKLPMKTSRVKFATAMIRRAVGRGKRRHLKK